MEAQLITLDEAAEINGGIAEWTGPAADIATIVGIGFGIYFGTKNSSDTGAVAAVAPKYIW